MDGACQQYPQPTVVITLFSAKLQILDQKHQLLYFFKLALFDIMLSLLKYAFQ